MIRGTVYTGSVRIARALTIVLTVPLAAACVTTVRTAERMVESTNRVELYVRVAGTPTSDNVLVVVNGGPGHSSHYVLDLEQLADDGVAIVTFDPRGVARSTAPRPMVAGNFSLSRYSDDVEAIRRDLGVDQIDILGHSHGALVAMEYAIEHPGHVSSLILVGSPFPTSDGLETQSEEAAARYAELVREGAIRTDLPSGSPEALIERTRSAFADPSLADEFARTVGRDVVINDMVHDWSIQMLHRYDLTDGLAEVSCPVLVVTGSADVGAHSAEQVFRAALPAADVSFVLLENCGHFWQECPGPFYEAVREFLGIVHE